MTNTVIGRVVQQKNTQQLLMISPFGLIPNLS